MDSDKVVTATFDTTPPPTYTLMVNVVGNGSVTRSPSQMAYISGTLVQLTAEPDPGWTFIEWSGDLSVSTNPVNLTMDGDKVVTATFSLSCVDVSGASFTFAPTEPVVGETVTFTGSVAAGDAPAYAWDFGDDSTLQTGNPIVHTFPSTSTEQTYTVVMTASNSCPSQNTVSHAVTVRPHRIYLPLVMRNYSS
jgi:PKD repeat protein